MITVFFYMTLSLLAAGEVPVPKGKKGVFAQDSQVSLREL